jgi:PIN domain nuclease of toxin-antitoxin system
VSAISCWEVEKLVERGRLKLPMQTDQWLHAALAYPGVKLLELSPDIVATDTHH